MPSVIRALSLVPCACLLVACTAAGGRTVIPTRSDPPPVATRTTVEARVGDETVMVTEIVRIGADARAVSRARSMVLFEEVLVGDDHYARAGRADLVLGVDRWIHTDLTDPGQRRYLRANPIGVIAEEEAATLGAGDDYGGHAILGVGRHGATRVLDLGDGGTLHVTVETVRSAGPIEPPDPTQVVDLLDLPDLLASR